MAQSQVWGLALVLCLAGWVSAAPCPLHCDCAAPMLTCDGDHVWSWGEILSHMPEDIEGMLIHGGHLHLEYPSQKSKLRVPKPNLYNLTIIDCNVTEFKSEAFKLVPHLRELHLEYVHVQEYVEKVTFEHVPDIENLNLLNTDIHKVEDETFQRLHNLVVLNISHNALNHISQDVFKNLLNLKTLDLSHNQIEYVHPKAFSNLTSLEVLSMQSNHLPWLQPNVLANLSSLQQVDLRDNPWTCYCGIRWLAQFVEKFPDLIVGGENVTCQSPEYLQSYPLSSLGNVYLTCDPPVLDDVPANFSAIGRMHDLVLHCNASGLPPPSIYWVTPRGVVAHETQKQWITEKYFESQPSLSFAGKPSFLKAVVEVLDSGHLHFHQFRYYFAGEYKCVAENPGGVVEYAFNITIDTNVDWPFVVSVVYGFIVSGSVLFVGIIVGSIRTCAERFCCKKEGEESLSSLDISDEWYEEEPTPGTEPFHPWHMPWMWSPSFSRDESPRKCVTPAEGVLGTDVPDEELPHNILERLEDVRALLRHSMQRSVSKLRTGAHYVRESAQQVRESGSRRVHTIRESTSSRLQNVRANSSRRLQTIRSSSSQYMATIRESGSQRMRNWRSSTGLYVTRMRSGVNIGMDSVKSNFRSIKEFCGPGDIANTVSTISVSTDVDSCETTEVVKTVTYL